MKSEKNAIYLREIFVQMKMIKIKKNRKKVKDHCHYTGKFRGAAHSKCNLNYKVPKNIPIVIHNAGYDTHFIISQLAEEFKGELDCIRENMEKILLFLYQLRKNMITTKQLLIN